MLIQQVALFLLTCLPANAQNVSQIEPHELAALVADSASERPIVVHYTSDDGSCSFCVNNIATFESAAERLSESYGFYAVTLNPWRQFFDGEQGKFVTDFQTEIGFSLRGVPAVMIFHKGEPVRMFAGEEKSLVAELEEAFEVITDQELVVRGDIQVAHLPLAQIGAYIEAFSSEKPVLLTFSSIDEKCTHCALGNERIDEVSRYLSEDFFFLRTDFVPWRSFATDREKAAVLSSLGIEINGLPTSVVFFEGSLKGSVVTNGRDLRTVLSQALPTIVGREN